MKFRDEREEDRWSSLYDALASVGNVRREECCIYADSKIEAMRERKAKPAWADPANYPDHKGLSRSECGALERVATKLRTLRAECEAHSGRRLWQFSRISALTDAILAIDAELARQPADELPPKVKAMSQAPGTGGPPPLGGGRIHYAIQRGAEVAWQRMWAQRLHLSHCEADRAHVIDCVYDAMVDSIVEHPPTLAVDTTEMGDHSGADYCAPGAIQPPRSERGALERLRACVKGLGETRISKETILIYIDAELARQPADELSPKVAEVVEAARAFTNGEQGAYDRLLNAVRALDGGGDE